jgi:hypothetical protein
MLSTITISSGERFRKLCTVVKCAMADHMECGILFPFWYQSSFMYIIYYE